MTGWAKSHCCEASREALPVQRIRESVAEAKQIAGEMRFKPRPEIRAACVCSCVQLFVIDYRTIGSYNRNVRPLDRSKQNVLAAVKEKPLWSEETQSRRF